MNSTIFWFHFSIRFFWCMTLAWDKKIYFPASWQVWQGFVYSTQPFFQQSIYHSDSAVSQLWVSGQSVIKILCLVFKKWSFFKSITGSLKSFENTQGCKSGYDVNFSFSPSTKRACTEELLTSRLMLHRLYLETEWEDVCVSRSFILLSQPLLRFYESLDIKHFTI